VSYATTARVLPIASYADFVPRCFDRGLSVIQGNIVVYYTVREWLKKQIEKFYALPDSNDAAVYSTDGWTTEEKEALLQQLIRIDKDLGAENAGKVSRGINSLQSSIWGAAENSVAESTVTELNTPAFDERPFNLIVVHGSLGLPLINENELNIVNQMDTRDLSEFVKRADADSKVLMGVQIIGNETRYSNDDQPIADMIQFVARKEVRLMDAVSIMGGMGQINGLENAVTTPPDPVALVPQSPPTEDFMLNNPPDYLNIQ